MATTVDNSVPAFFSTSAEFRAWGLKVAALIAATMTKVADVGTIDWTTVAAPGAINTYMGFEIYRFNDTGQATTPIYAKVEYGSGNAVSRPSLRIQIGPSTNGSGTLTGVWASTQTAIAQVNTSAAGVVKQANVDSQAGLAVVMMGFDNSTNNFLFGFAIERWRDSNGNPTTEGLSIILLGGTPAAFGVSEQFIYPAGATVRAQRTTLNILLPPYSSVEGSDAGIFPHIPNNGKDRYPSLGIMGQIFADVAPGSTPNISRYGVTRTYKAITGAATTVGFGSTSSGLSMLFD